MVLCLGERTSEKVFVVLHLIFVSSFHFYIFISFFIFILLLCFLCRFSSLTFAFLTSSITLPWTISGFLHPFYTFSSSHCRVICDTFIFQPFRDLLTASAMALSGHFLPTGVFYITLFHRHF